MSWRRLHEPARAAEQRALTVEERLRRLESRTWGGAIRSVSLSSYISTVGAFETAASLTLNAGRWAILQRGNVTITTAAVGAFVSMAGTMRATTVTPSTNPLAPAPSTRSTPPIQSLWDLGLAVSKAEMTMCDFAVHSLDEQSTLDLILYVEGVASAAWNDLRLLAIPA